MQLTPVRARALTTLYYGGFLIFAGLLGFAYNPEAAKTALISGGVFGTLFLIYGVAMFKEVAVFRWVALGTAIFLPASSPGGQPSAGKLSARVNPNKSQQALSLRCLWVPSHYY